MGILTDKTASTISRRPRRSTSPQVALGGALAGSSPGCPCSRCRTQWRLGSPGQAPIQVFSRPWVWLGEKSTVLVATASHYCAGFDHRESSGSRSLETCACRQRSDRGPLTLNANRPGCPPRQWRRPAWRTRRRIIRLIASFCRAMIAPARLVEGHRRSVRRCCRRLVCAFDLNSCRRHRRSLPSDGSRSRRRRHIDALDVGSVSGMHQSGATQSAQAV